MVANRNSIKRDIMVDVKLDAKKYAKLYKLKKKEQRDGHKRTTRDFYIGLPNREIKVELPEDFYFVPDSIIEVCCSTFGCGRLLNYQEKLFGDKCSSCSGNKQKIVFK